METLLRTLEHELTLKEKRVTGHRLIYFIDNMVTYDVFRKGSSKSQYLWTLLLEINFLNQKFTLSNVTSDLGFLNSIKCVFKYKNHHRHTNILMPSI